ncbi:hypothetical protein OGAPHI_006331 [Ogataea philodendri]|uniref:Inosine/uridine-preferring nucleoside hydrolase domain-containing protein n=1 Tax=Ogataea philodendri TaxID=1378263 RepID=A0A9P8NYN2_9ASCO|nr:uncharacterized protein OGAPHI_006331 [Ogataea philodendri]KAH3661484.1 hypothetical protein OGAPHI_006331 [Ogataea philodendri]
MRKVLIDCDPGIDDASALLLALAPGNLDVKAITTVSGNLRASDCTNNLKKILSMIDRTDIPVGQGPEKPLVRKYPRDPFSHGSDGLGDLDMPELNSTKWDESGASVAVASDLIVDTVNKYPGQISMVCLGPLTNLALALIKDPQLPSKLEKVIIIGGSFGFSPSEALHATGDNPVSEWNIYVDPEAAELVWGAKFNLTAIGMDIFCQPCIAMTQKYQDKLALSSSVAAKFILSVLAWLRRRNFGDYCALIDSLAVAYAIDESIMETEKVDCLVETKSEIALGQVVVDRRKNFKWDNLPQIDAVCTVNGEKYLSILTDGFTKY